MKCFPTALAMVFIPLPGRSIEIASSNVDIASGTDLTLEAGASGEDVVDACLQKLGLIPSFVFGNDFGFLKRVALVESNFGLDDNLNPTGGIWQISQAMHEALISFSTGLFSSDIEAIATVFGQDLVDFSSNDYSIPLKSAIAARIFIEFTLSGDIPGSLQDQGSWWATNYRPGSNSNDFVTTVQEFEDVTRCNVSKLDLWFLIDASGSVGSANFQTSLEFVSDTAAAFSISPDEVRTGLMIYSSTTNLISQFDEHQSNAEFSQVVLSTFYTGGGTATGAAITRVREDGFNVATGARPPTEAVPRILVVLTDGQSGDDVAQPSAEIKASGVTVFGVGVGSGFNNEEVNEIASDPDSNYAFEFTQFDALAEVLRERVATQACTVPAVVPENTTVSLTLESTVTLYFQVLLPIDGSVEIAFQVTATVVVYLSDSVPNPSSALFDFVFTVLEDAFPVVIVNSAEDGSLTGTGKRKKRQAPGEGQTIYVAIESQSPNPLQLDLTATQSDVRAEVVPATTEAAQKHPKRVKDNC